MQKRLMDRALAAILAVAWISPVFGQGGSVDPAFKAGGGVGVAIHRVAVQADGRILAAGDFTAYDGVPATGIIRLKPNGEVDDGFNPGSGFKGTTIILPGVFTNTAPPAFQFLLPTSAGLLVGGGFDEVDGQPRTNLVRLLASGAVDPGFVAHADGQVIAAAELPGGKLLVGGGFKMINGVARAGLAKLNADGSVDSFNPSWGAIAASVRSIKPLGNGQILLGGGFTSFLGGLSQTMVVRMNENGTLDDTFAPPAAQFLTDFVLDMLVQADERIVVIGTFRQIAGTPRKGIARLTSKGAIDDSWPGNGAGAGGLEGISAIGAAPNGQLYVGGSFKTLNDVGPGGIARLNSDGTHDLDFEKPEGSTTFSVSTLAVQTDGNVVIGGIFTLGTTTESTKTLLRLLAREGGPPPRPTITRDPEDLSAPLNAVGRSLSVAAAGTPPLSYQWQHHGADLPFKTDPVLNFGAIKESDAGPYQVIVRNAGGAVTSRVATLSVILPARIVRPPQSLTVILGEAAVYSAEVEGTPPFLYQWRKDSSDLAGETAAVLTIPSAKLSDAGAYSVAVSNAAGGETSAEAQLLVNYPKPEITLHPLSQTVTLPQTNLTAETLDGRDLCLTVAGALPPWIDHGSYCIAFEGAQYASPAGGALATASSGGFTVGQGIAPPATLIHFANFFPDGQTATITLLANAIYEFNRENLVADQNGRWELRPPFVPPPPPGVTFTVRATSPGILSYQWHKDGGRLAGQTGDTLTLNAVTMADAGDYSVVVSGPGGDTMSEVAHLTVNPPGSLELGAVKLTPGGRVQFTLNTAAGVTYHLRIQNALGSSAWNLLQTIVGDGSVQTIEAEAGGTAGFYQVVEAP